MEDSPRFERLWTRTVLVGVVVLSAYLLITEWDGFVRLAAWFWAGLSAAPQSLSNIAAYYAALPFAQLLPSLIIGALVGIGMTWRTIYHTAQPRPILTLLGGGLVGAFSAQILSATIQHCTYLPEVAAAETIGGWVITALSAMMFLVPYWAYLKRAPVSQAGYFRQRGLAYAFLAPTLVSLFVFLYYPSVQTILLSLNARRFPIRTEKFVCLGNYVSLAEDAIYQSSFVTTVLITLAIVTLSLAIALGVAVLASQKVRGASIYRTFLIWPFALSPVVTGVIFLALFRDGQAGLINYVLTSGFGAEVSWLRTPDLARWVIVIASVWNILGFNILFYVAGLQGVPPELLEAAAIDGANKPQRFFSITFPLLSPYTFFLLITNVTYSFYGIYGVVDALTSGGPPVGPAGIYGGATNVLIFKLYEDAFTPGAPIGSAAAQAIILFICIAGLTLFQFRFVESRVTYAE